MWHTALIPLSKGKRLSVNAIRYVIFIFLKVQVFLFVCFILAIVFQDETNTIETMVPFEVSVKFMSTKVCSWYFDFFKKDVGTFQAFLLFFSTMVIQYKQIVVFWWCLDIFQPLFWLLSVDDVFLKFEPLEHIVVDIPFLLMANIRSSSPWPILLASSSLQMLTMSSNTPQAPSQLQGGTTIFFTNAI